MSLCVNKHYSLKSEEKATGHENKDDGQREHTTLPGQHNTPITVEAVFSRENLPFPPYTLQGFVGGGPGGRCSERS